MVRRQKIILKLSRVVAETTHIGAFVQKYLTRCLFYAFGLNIIFYVYTISWSALPIGGIPLTLLTGPMQLVRRRSIILTRWYLYNPSQAVLIRNIQKLQLSGAFLYPLGYLHCAPLYVTTVEVSSNQDVGILLMMILPKEVFNCSKYSGSILFGGR